MNLLFGSSSFSSGLVSSSSKPVAITVTITSSFKFSLITAPKIILISLLALCLTTSAASSASNRVKLVPPVTFIIASFAPTILVSKSGDDTACFAASIALFSPTPKPNLLMHYHVFP